MTGAQQQLFRARPHTMLTVRNRPARRPPTHLEARQQLGEHLSLHHHLCEVYAVLCNLGQRAADLQIWCAGKAVEWCQGRQL